MISRGRQTQYFLIILLFPLASWSNPACKLTDFERAMKSKDEIAKKEIEEMEKPEFHYACQEPYSLYKRPIANLVLPDLNVENIYGQKTLDFMKPLSGAVLKYAYENLAAWDGMETCLTTRKSSPECADVLKFMRTDLPEYINTARYNLALGVDPLWSTDSESLNVNSTMKNLESRKEFDWEPLSKDEKIEAQSTLDQYISKSIHATNPKLPKYQKFQEVVKKVKSTRMRHMEKYQLMFSNFGLMNYITKAKPTDEDLLRAIRMIKARATKEIVQLTSAQASLKDGVTSESLVFLKYNALVEGQLLQNPKACGLATYLNDAAAIRGVGKALAIGLPILAATMFAPPLIPGAAGIFVSVGIGAAAGVGFALSAQDDLEEGRRRNLNNAKNLNTKDLQKSVKKIDSIQLALRKEPMIKKLEEQISTLPAGPDKDLLEKRYQLEKTPEYQNAVGEREVMLEPAHELDQLAMTRNLSIAAVPLVAIAPGKAITFASTRLSQMRNVLVRLKNSGN